MSLWGNRTDGAVGEMGLTFGEDLRGLLLQGEQNQCRIESYPGMPVRGSSRGVYIICTYVYSYLGITHPAPLGAEPYKPYPIYP